jgi:hypothetical protein
LCPDSTKLVERLSYYKNFVRRNLNRWKKYWAEEAPTKRNNEEIVTMKKNFEYLTDFERL